MDESFSFPSTQQDNEACPWSDDEHAPLSPAALKIAREQYSFFALKRMAHERGELRLDPEFQRNHVWSSRQKWDLLESILMGIPLPVFYFAKDKYGVLAVVDGLQRLSTVFDFMDGKFSLGKLKYLKHCQGKSFGQLERIQQAYLEKFQVMVYVINPPTPERVKLDIFDRINRGGTPLNKQEMRNALYVGKSTEFLARLSRDESFLAATGNRLSDLRMRDRYVILRAVCFYIAANQERYALSHIRVDTRMAGDLDDFLARYMQLMNEMRDQDLEDVRLRFAWSMAVAWALYGQDGFTRTREAGAPLHMGLFESIFFCFAHLDAARCGTGNSLSPCQQNALREAMDALIQQNFFQDYLDRSTTNIRRMEAHFQALATAVPQLQKGVSCCNESK